MKADINETKGFIGLRLRADERHSRRTGGNDDHEQQRWNYSPLGRPAVVGRKSNGGDANEVRRMNGGPFDMADDVQQAGERRAYHKHRQQQIADRIAQARMVFGQFAGCGITEVCVPPPQPDQEDRQWRADCERQRRLIGADGNQRHHGAPHGNRSPEPVAAAGGGPDGDERFCGGGADENQAQRVEVKRTDDGEQGTHVRLFAVLPRSCLKS